MSTIISLHWEYVEAILAGKKNIEFRRGRLNVKQGSPLYAYCTGEKRFRISAKVVESSICKRDNLYIIMINLMNLGVLPGISGEEYLNYTSGCEFVTAIRIDNIQPFPGPTLQEMRDRFPGWNPPQRVAYKNQKSREIFDFIESNINKK